MFHLVCKITFHWRCIMHKSNKILDLSFCLRAIDDFLSKLWSSYFLLLNNNTTPLGKIQIVLNLDFAILFSKMGFYQILELYVIRTQFSRQLISQYSLRQVSIISKLTQIRVRKTYLIFLGHTSNLVRSTKQVPRICPKMGLEQKMN